MWSSNYLLDTTQRKKPLKPFLKWAGGKQKLAPTIKKLFDEVDWTEAKLYEPFFGGGAVAWHINPHRAEVSDINLPLISVYRNVPYHYGKIQQLYNGWIEEYLDLGDDEKLKKSFYEGKRIYFNNLIKTRFAMDSPHFIALYILMNKTCFNGLMRFNSKGLFNTPYGRYKTYPLLDLNPYCHSLFIWHVHNSDFDTMLNAQVGDYVYCDPPYIDKFVSYDKSSFKLADHHRLSNNMELLARKNVKVITSGSDTELTREVYCKHKIMTVNCGSNINPKAKRKITELLITNF